MEWNGMEWDGMEWSGMEWSGVEWSGVEWNSISNIREHCKRPGEECFVKLCLSYEHNVCVEY